MGQAALPQPHENEFTDMPVGEILQRTRVHYGQSLEDVEAALRIRASQIDAIEQGALERLPGRVYAIGFVRAYAEYLGLDGAKMVELFKRQTAGAAPEPELQFPVCASESRLPSWWVIALCFVAALSLVAFWLGGGQEERKLVEDIPPVPEKAAAPETVSAEEQAFGPTVDEPQAPEEEEAVIEEKPAEGIILNIQQNSWVEIRDTKGRALLSRVLKAGDQYYVPDRPDLTISIGNAAGVSIEVDGQPLRQLGETGKVLRRLPLDADYLKKNFALEQVQ